MTETIKETRTVGELTRESNRLHDENVKLRVQIEDYVKMEKRFQFTCIHKYGRMFDGKSRNLCANCGWDMDKCQHKDSIERSNKFCGECGAAL